MSKKHITEPTALEKTIMAKVMSCEISMKPRWYFLLGSVFMMLGAIGLSIGAVFLANLTLFLLRSHGPMGQWRLQTMLTSFPWWVPILAVIGMILGIRIFRKYDFSYKKNFPLIVIGFIASILIAAAILDFSGLSDTWFTRGPMRQFYQRLERQDPALQENGRFGRQKTNIPANHVQD